MTEETIPLLSNRENYISDSITNIPNEIIDKILYYIPEAYNKTVQISKRFADRSRKINYSRAANIWLNQIIDIQNSKYWLPDILEYDNHIHAAYSSNLQIELSDRRSKIPLYRYSPLYNCLASSNFKHYYRNTLSSKWYPTFTVSMCRDPCMFSIGILLIIGLCLFVGLYTIPRYLTTMDKLYYKPGENSDVHYYIDNYKYCIASIVHDGINVPSELPLIVQAVENIKWSSLLSSFRTDPHFDEYFNNTGNWLIDRWNKTDKNTVIRNDTVYYASLIKLKLFIVISDTRELDMSLYLYQYSRICLIEYAKKVANSVLAGQMIVILILFMVLLVMFIYNYYSYRVKHL